MLLYVLNDPKLTYSIVCRLRGGEGWYCIRANVEAIRLEEGGSDKDHVEGSIIGVGGRARKQLRCALGNQERNFGNTFRSSKADFRDIPISAASSDVTERAHALFHNYVDGTRAACFGHIRTLEYFLRVQSIFSTDLLYKHYYSSTTVLLENERRQFGKGSR